MIHHGFRKFWEAFHFRSISASCSLSRSLTPLACTGASRSPRLRRPQITCLTARVITMSRPHLHPHCRLFLHHLACRSRYLQQKPFEPTTSGFPSVSPSRIPSSQVPELSSSFTNLLIVRNYHYGRIDQSIAIYLL